MQAQTMVVDFVRIRMSVTCVRRFCTRGAFQGVVIMAQGENARPADQVTVQLGGAYENLEHLSLAARLSKQ